MARRLSLLILILGVLAGCGRLGESRLNPFNWFGRDREITPVVVIAAEDPRPLVAAVTTVRIERAPGGALLTAVGLPPRQGYWAPALLPVSGPPGTLSYQFRLEPPAEPTRVSTPQSREVTVGTFISDQRLFGIREVRVLGAQQSRSVRR